MRTYINCAFIVITALVIDQAVKTWVKFNMYLGQDILLLGRHGMLHYTENNGMAFGLELGGETGKILLTLFRIIAVGFIGYGLNHLIVRRYHKGLIYSTALIFAGALGNIIDSVFYGKLYGYAPLFQGRVIDMLYFPLLQGTFPKWLPVWGGEEYIFFRPVFNIADAAISLGVIIILLNQKRFFKDPARAQATVVPED